MRPSEEANRPTGRLPGAPGASPPDARNADAAAEHDRRDGAQMSHTLRGSGQSCRSGDGGSPFRRPSRPGMLHTASTTPGPHGRQSSGRTRCTRPPQTLGVHTHRGPGDTPRRPSLVDTGLKSLGIAPCLVERRAKIGRSPADSGRSRAKSGGPPTPVSVIARGSWGELSMRRALSRRGAPNVITKSGADPVELGRVGRWLATMLTTKKTF